MTEESMEMSMEESMEESIEYTEPLTGTLAEAAELDPLGIGYEPLARMWQVNPGAEAVPAFSDETEPGEGMVTKSK
ncbi:hypothetical protein NDK47_05430 [Brevibacillus ruminantium]|uniref:Uncharacterized protein n=1 Tax=Brevibacillus ruminantium TaxID=2950604 RepID=A0ABY4WHW1_9BACL|nr:hypothetical protein [Brevibacillus ruminantium]USG66740.1 hypothetical protein NDK47_05430 [Brevibacillus ruminantium]